MLYDPKWSKPEVKADPFKLETLIAWLEKQPADKPYDYTCNGHCLLAQYFSSYGFSDVNMAGQRFFHRDGIMVDLPKHFNDVACGTVEPIFSMRRTFGAALERARALHCAND